MSRLALFSVFIIVASFAVFFVEPVDVKNWVMWISGLSPVATYLILLVSVLVYAVTFAFVIPVNTVLLIAFGYMYGFPEGFMVALIATVIGALAIFYSSKGALYSVCKFLLDKNYERVLEFARKEPLTFLLTTRFAPFVPFPVAHTIPAHAHISPRLFLSVTLLGTVPAALVFTFVGSTLQHANEVNQSLVESLTLGLVLISLLVLSTLGARFFLKKKNLYKEEHVALYSRTSEKK